MVDKHWHSNKDAAGILEGRKEKGGKQKKKSRNIVKNDILEKVVSKVSNWVCRKTKISTERMPVSHTFQHTVASVKGLQQMENKASGFS